MKCNKPLLSLIAAAFFITSCSENDTPQAALGAYDNGILILNQGNFGDANSEVSYLSNDFATLQNSIFGTVNQGALLGDTGQDIGFNGDQAYIVMNYSDKIQIVNRHSFASEGSISTGLYNPRYIAFSSGKAYVSNWGDPNNTSDDYIAVIELSNLSQTQIPVAEGPERLVINGNKLYVAQTGGYGFGSTVTVINTDSDTVQTTIEVGDVPNSMVVTNNALFVMCGGKPSYSGAETSGVLTAVNLQTNAVVAAIEFGALQHPSNLIAEGSSVYYSVDSSIFKANSSLTALPSSPIITTTPQGIYGIYSLAVKNGKVFVGDAIDYISNGKIYIYNETGVLEQSYTVGLLPSGFYFN